MTLIADENELKRIDSYITMDYNQDTWNHLDVFLRQHVEDLTAIIDNKENTMKYNISRGLRYDQIRTIIGYLNTLENEHTRSMDLIEEFLYDSAFRTIDYFYYVIKNIRESYKKSYYQEINQIIETSSTKELNKVQVNIMKETKEYNYMIHLINHIISLFTSFR